MENPEQPEGNQEARMGADPPAAAADDRPGQDGAPARPLTGRAALLPLARLFLASFAALFFEVLLIRWLPGELPLLGYFRSLVLLAAFLGLGLGFLAQGRGRDSGAALLAAFLAGLALISVGAVFGGEAVRWWGFGPSSHVLGQGQADNYRNVRLTLEFFGRGTGGGLVVGASFLAAVFAFFPLGVLTARLFAPLAPLSAYLANIGGAICGTLAFTALSLLSLQPPAWFACGLASLLPLFFPLSGRRPRLFAALACVGAFLAVFPPVLESARIREVLWSPYQRLSWETIRARLALPSGQNLDTILSIPVYVNREYHQQMMHLDLGLDSATLGAVLSAFDERAVKKGFRSLAVNRMVYEEPYRRSAPKSVLIIASGVGNEAAAALRNGAPQIDAVEIDPGIAALGKHLHPDHPYDSPRVRLFVDDARNFLRGTNKRYDLIVMNAVDAHSQYATSAGLRLDSTIFTKEFFEDVRAHMAEDGLFAMLFSGFHWYGVPWSRARMAEILWRVFGYTPDAENSVGPHFFIRKGSPPPPEAWHNNVRISTDDWPEFYLAGPVLPNAYVLLILFVLAVSGLLVAAAPPRDATRPDGHFFFLGAGFMLLEIRGISESLLSFGNTWMVNSIVITAVLLATGAANAAAMLFPRLSRRTGYLILATGVAAGLLLSPGALLGHGLPPRLALAALRLGLPVLGAGLVFARSFQQSPRPSAAFGWNLLGAMAGGLCEYASLVTGIHALGWIIAAFYTLSAAFLWGRKG